MKRVLRFFGLLLGAALLLALVTVVWITWASLPEHDGTLQVVGLTAPVTISRDAQGVPTIDAQTEADALFALGYVHAQDRLWQMELNRRVAQGRLAELFGPPALEADRLFRTLGSQQVAHSVAAHLDAPTRALVDAYAAGVNAYLDTRRGPLPPEFWLTWAPAPAPWTAADCAAWAGVMAWDLSSVSSRIELRRLRLAQTLTQAEIDEFRPPAPDSVPPGLADYVERYRLMGLVGRAAVAANDAVLAQAWPGAGFGDSEALGSNNWVVSGAHTRSGAPLLANDPHLGLTTPSVWYFARLRAPGLDVFGATLVGVPYVMLGRNRNVAWGFTNTAPDAQDMYLERINPADPTEYATPTGYAKFETREELIAVRGAEPLRLTVRSTRHGPVVSGALTSADKALPQNTQYVLALQWTALQPRDTTLTALRGMNRAADAREFEAALRDWQLAQQSIVFADRAGRIGFIAPGRIPRRKSANDLMGMAPAPGWDARYDWDGWLAFEEMPRVLDPPDGVLATANNKIVPLGTAQFLTADWFGNHRVDRIKQLLAAGGPHDAQSFRRIQADVTSLAAREMLEALRSLQPPPAPPSTAAQIVLARLLVWDGTMAAAAPEPLLYHAWLRKLRMRLFADDMGEAGADLVAHADLQAVTVAVLSGRTRARDWCDDRTTRRHETCSEIVAAALEQAAEELGAQGQDLLALRWDERHRALIEHRPLSAVPLLASLFGRAVPVGGDTHTVNVGALRLHGKQPYATSHAATFRAIYDLSTETGGQWIHSGGQVGHPASRHYDDLLARWQQVELLPIAVQPQAVHTLRLAPN